MRVSPSPRPSPHMAAPLATQRVRPGNAAGTSMCFAVRGRPCARRPCRSSIQRRAGEAPLEPVPNSRRRRRRAGRATTIPRVLAERMCRAGEASYNPTKPSEFSMRAMAIFLVARARAGARALARRDIGDQRAAAGNEARQCVVWSHWLLLLLQVLLLLRHIEGRIVVRVGIEGVVGRRPIIVTFRLVT